MANVDLSISGQVGDLIGQMRAAASAARAAGGDYDAMGKAIAALKAEMAKMAKGQDAVASALTEVANSQTLITKGMKGVESARRRAAKAEAEYTQTVNRTEMAQQSMGETLKRVTAVAGLSEDAQAALSRVTDQYGEILNEVGDNQGYLLNQWKRALPTAEKTARQLAELVAFSTEAERETDAYRTAVEELSKSFENKLGRQTRNAGRSLSDLFDEQNALLAQTKDQSAEVKALADAYSLQQKRADALEKAMTSLGIPGAGLIKTFKDQSDSLKTLAESGSVAEVRLLKTAIAVGTVAAAGAALVAGGVAVGAAIVSITAKSAEWNRELEKLGLNLDREATRKVNKAEAAIGAVGMVAKAAGTEIGAIFSPAVTEAGTRLVAATLAVRDFFKEMDDGSSLLEKGTKKVAEGVEAIINAPTDAYQYLTGELPLRMIAAGVEFAGFSEEADQLRQTFDALSDSAGPTIALDIDAMGGAMADAVRDGVEPLNNATESYMDRARELVGKQGEINAALHGGKDAAKAYGEALIEAEQRGAAAIGAVEGTLIDLLAERRAAQQEADAEKVAGLQAYVEASRQVAAEDMARIEATKREEMELAALRQSAAMQGIQLAQSGARLASAILKKSRGEQSRALQAMFYVEQGAAAAGVIVNTALAVTKAFAQYGPPPSPAGIAAALAAGIAGASSLATIAATTISGSGSIGSVPMSAPSPAASRGTSTTATTAVANAGVVGGSADTRKPTPVSDAYIPATGGPRALALTSGDEAVIMRSGPMGFSESLGEMLKELRGLRADMASLGRLLRSDRTDQRLRAAMQEVGPARRY